MSEGILVVTTTSCNRCPAFKEELHKLDLKGHSIEYIDEERSDFMKVCKDYNLTSAPVVLLFDNDNSVVYQGDDVDELKKHL